MDAIINSGEITSFQVNSLDFVFLLFVDIVLSLAPVISFSLAFALALNLVCSWSFLHLAIYLSITLAPAISLVPARLSVIFCFVLISCPGPFISSSLLLHFPLPLFLLLALLLLPPGPGPGESQSG